MRNSHDQPRVPLNAVQIDATEASPTAALIAELEVVLMERQDVIVQLEHYASMALSEHRGAAAAALRVRLRQLRVRQDALLTSLDELLVAARAATPARRRRAA